MRSRLLGEEIRHALSRANITGKQLSGMLGWSESRVSRTITGLNPPSEVDLAAILALCRITGEERESILDLSRTDDYQHLRTKKNAMTGHVRQVVKISEFCDSVLPALLQTPDYTGAVLTRAATLSLQETESWIAQVQHAQVAIGKNEVPVDCHFFIHEQVLRLPVGGKKLMCQQLGYLLSMSKRRYITIRIIPAKIGAYPGIGHPFCLLEFKDDMPVVYDEDEVSGSFTEYPDRIAAITQARAGMSAVSLLRGESRVLIQEIMDDLYSDSGDGDQDDEDGVADDFSDV
jgi:transcriptional regulator with XRE-family HTH domain